MIGNYPNVTEELIVKQTSLRRFAQCVGIVAAVAVPAMVVGQSIQGLQSLDLSDGSVLRGQDVRVLRDALAAAVGRIDQLENRLNAVGGGITKASVYTRSAAVALPELGDRNTASASCDAATDIAIDCACGGDTGAGTSGFAGNDLRIVLTANPAAGLSRCDCVGENAIGNASQRLVAIVTCLNP